MEVGHEFIQHLASCRVYRGNCLRIPKEPLDWLIRLCNKSQDALTKVICIAEVKRSIKSVHDDAGDRVCMQRMVNIMNGAVIRHPQFSIMGKCTFSYMV